MLVKQKVSGGDKITPRSSAMNISPIIAGLRTLDATATPVNARAVMNRGVLCDRTAMTVVAMKKAFAIV
jgi:hypothetical protein